MNEKQNAAPAWLMKALPIVACVLLVLMAALVVLPRLQDLRDRGVTEVYATAAPDTTPSPDEKLK